ncbi:MAG: hypothetical protein IPK19_15220 [Chloroflexi bacterium]|nr:hypothetical protein [Chloroflexota bacterium]
MAGQDKRPTPSSSKAAAKSDLAFAPQAVGCNEVYPAISEKRSVHAQFYSRKLENYGG